MFSDGVRFFRRLYVFLWLAVLSLSVWRAASASEFLYGIHDFDPRPTEFLDRLQGAGVRGWVVATEAALDGSRDRGRAAEAVFSRTLRPGRHIVRLQVDETPYIDRIAVEFPAPREVFKRGNANAEGEVDIGDAVFILQYFFASGAPPSCFDAADTNDDGTVDLADAISLLSYLFVSQSALPPPGSACGEDPTQDGLDCREFAPCN